MVIYEGETHLGNDVGALPTEERLMEEEELGAEFAHVISDSEAVRQSCHPVDNLLIGVSDEPLTERMLPIKNKVEYPPHRIIR